METKFGLMDEVFFLNTTCWKIASGKVKGIRIIPTAMSKDAEGNDVVDAYEVIYALDSEVALTQGELFSSREECVAFLTSLGGRV